MKLIRKHINEKFTEDSDPIHDLGIGMDAVIKNWIETETDEKYNKEDPLWICAKYGKTEFVKYLLDKGYDVHYDNDMALRLSSINGHTNVVKLLLDHGADVHTNDDYALRWASEIGHTDVVKLLLDNGADVHAKNDEALRWASRYGHINVVKLLLDHGANVHVKDDEALRYASRYGHTDTVKLLLDHGANVHANDDEALQWASLNRHTNTVKLLKDHIAKEKVVKESIINEKFIEDSYLIYDLDIGIDTVSKKDKEIIEESLDLRKEAEKKTTYLTDNKKLGLQKKIIAILNDSNKKRVKICTVNGSYVKSTEPGLGFKEFVEGGHHYVDSYPGYKRFIPEDEIWVDDVFKSKPEELKAIIQHEFIERNLMKYKKWSYNKAHEYANKREAELRKK